MDPTLTDGSYGEPMESKMKIEVGKTYLTRDGQKITIQSESGYRGTWRMQGVDEIGRLTWRSRKGRFERRPSKLDLVAEA
jgi:hypothetical protein